jgi:hypothetical protein
VVSLFAFLPAAGMDKKEGEFRTFLILISFSLQWIRRRWENCHLDSADRRKDKNSQSKFRLGNVAVVFTRWAVSRISGPGSEIDHLVN